MAGQKPRAAAPPPQPRRPADALERLYVYWIVSTALLLVGLLITILVTRGVLQNRAQEYNRAIDQLAERVAVLEQSLAETGTSAPATGPAGISDTRAPTAQLAETRRPAATRPTTRPRREPSSEAAPAAAALAVPSDAELRARLDHALVAGTVTPFLVADVRAAGELLGQATEHVARAAWSAETWSRLATLARLLGKDALAEDLAERAYRLGDPLVSFAETSARVLLAQGRAQEARRHAEYFAEQTRGSPAARLLLASVFLALESFGTADELLAGIEAPAALPIPDKLAYARLCLGLQRWDKLIEAMSTVSAVPPELEREAGFLHALALIQQNQRLPEALGVLDYLADRVTPAGAPPADRRPGAEWVPRASEYEVATWRGVALLRGRQWEAARQALDHATGLQPDRPEAYYWRAILEVGQERPEAAKMFLQNALATSASFAPAWEALGQLALNSGDLNAATDNLQKALQANPQRASAHFALAIAYAKASRREPAAAALKAAFHLDPAYVDAARQTEVITRLFSPAELEALTTPESAPTSAEDRGP